MRVLILVNVSDSVISANFDNKAKQHSTTKAVAFPKKNELPQVGLDIQCTCDYYSWVNILCITRVLFFDI